MAGSRRISYFAFAAFAVAAGCSGGGGGGMPRAGATGGPATPTPTPGVVATPTPAAAGSEPAAGVPSPVSTTVGAVQTVPTRPLASGDRFTYAGLLVTTFAFNGTSPRPTVTSIATVAQTVTLSGPTTANGVANQIDVRTAETDVAPLATETTTTDAYEALATVTGGQDLTESSSSSATSGGYTIGTTYPAPLVLDVLPETAGATFSNSPARTIAESEPGNFSSTRTYAADGGYTDTETYPSNGGTAPTATIVEHAAGDGTYSLPLQGYAANTLVSVGTPSPATSSGGSTIPLSLQVPDPTATAQSVTVPTWYALPLALYKESDLQTGSKPLPAACGVPATIATTANALVGRVERVDTVLGTDETTTQIGYVAQAYGLVCLQVTDVTDSYYDFAGETLDGIAVSNALVPLEVDTVQETIGLSAATTMSVARRSGGVAPEALGSGFARGAFDVAVARARDVRVRRAIDALRARAGGTAR